MVLGALRDSVLPRGCVAALRANLPATKNPSKVLSFARTRFHLGNVG
jgi:hypothetical protein